MAVSRIDSSLSLSTTERRELEADVRAHGLAAAARLHGLGRGAFASLLTGSHRAGTLALFRERRRAHREADRG